MISFKTDWFDFPDVQGTLKESSPALQFESINSVVLSLLYGPTLTLVHDPVIKAPSQNSILLFCGELSTALHTPGELDKAEDVIPVLKRDPGPVRPGRRRTQGGSGLCVIYVVDIQLNLKLHRPHWSGDAGIRDGGTGGSFQGEASFRVQR